MSFFVNLACLICAAHGLSKNYLPYRTANPSRVLVTGAAGRTGMLVFTSLLEDPRFNPIGMVRTEASAKKLIRKTKCGLDQVVVCDVTRLNVKKQVGLPEGLEGSRAMIVCTSAVPFLSKFSLVKSIAMIPFNLFKRKKVLDYTGLRFRFRRGQYPEKVDYKGQKAQIDLAKKLKLKQVVLVSSMGGTDPTNFLNSVGKKADGTGNGDILLWKRKAEEYLVDSGLNYCIIHPGGLVDAQAKQEKYVIDVDDALMQRMKRTIARADVANLCVAALTTANGENISLDCITEPVSEGTRVKSAEEALKAFLAEGKTTSYTHLTTEETVKTRRKSDAAFVAKGKAKTTSSSSQEEIAEPLINRTSIASPDETEEVIQ